MSGASFSNDHPQVRQNMSVSKQPGRVFLMVLVLPSPFFPGILLENLQKPRETDPIFEKDDGWKEWKRNQPSERLLVRLVGNMVE